jgi:hypothetical protein
VELRVKFHLLIPATMSYLGWAVYRSRVIAVHRSLYYSTTGAPVLLREYIPLTDKRQPGPLQHEVVPSWRRARRETPPGSTAQAPDLEQQRAGFSQPVQHNTALCTSDLPRPTFSSIMCSRLVRQLMCMPRTYPRPPLLRRGCWRWVEAIGMRPDLRQAERRSRAAPAQAQKHGK